MIAALVLAAGYPVCVQAHRDDYINETVVYLTLAHNEHEGEYWLDEGWHSGGHDYFTRHNIATELGITDKWMVDGRATIATNHGGPTTFESARFETRYRFSDEGVEPIDVATSFEVNTERETDGSHTEGVEPRLIFSKDVQEKLNFTINLSEEVPLDGESASTHAAFGDRYNWTELIRVGSELQYDLNGHSGAFIPQVWFAVTPETTLKIGYAARIDREPSNFVRAALEVEF